MTLRAAPSGHSDGRRGHDMTPDARKTDKGHCPTRRRQGAENSARAERNRTQQEVQIRVSRADRASQRLLPGKPTVSSSPRCPTSIRRWHRLARRARRPGGNPTTPSRRSSKKVGFCSFPHTVLIRSTPLTSREGCDLDATVRNTPNLPSTAHPGLTENRGVPGTIESAWLLLSGPMLLSPQSPSVPESPSTGEFQAKMMARLQDRSRTYSAGSTGTGRNRPIHRRLCCRTGS